MRRRARAALRAYPPSFRARYEEELSALVDDIPLTRPVTGDLLMGAARAWVHPRFSGAEAPRRRLQATLATTWVAWCVGFLAAPATTFAVLDEPSPRATTGVRNLLHAAQALFFTGWAFVLLGAAPVLICSVSPAMRGRSWHTLRPLVPALTLGVADAVGLLVLVLTRGSVTHEATPGFLIGTTVWLIGCGAFVLSLGIGPALTLDRLAPDISVLRRAALFTVPTVLTLIGLTTCCALATVRAGDAAILNSGVPVGAALAIAMVASVVATVSTARGLRTVRAR